MCGASAAIVGGSIVGGLLSSKGESKAAKATEKAGASQVAELRRQFDLTREDLRPFRETAHAALAELGAMLGLPGFEGGAAGTEARDELAAAERELAAARELRVGAPISPEQLREFIGSRPGGESSDPAQEAAFDRRSAIFTALAGGGGVTVAERERRIREAEERVAQARGNLEKLAPDGGAGDVFDRLRESDIFQFRESEGRRALETSAAARQGLLDPSTQRATVEFGQGLALDEFNQQFERLLRLAGLSAGPVQTGANIAVNTGQNVAGVLGDVGAARASSFRRRGEILGDIAGDASQLIRLGLLRPGGGTPPFVGEIRTDAAGRILGPV